MSNTIRVNDILEYLEKNRMRKVLYAVIMIYVIHTGISIPRLDCA